MSWRVLTYRDVLRKLDGLGAEVGFIELADHPAGRLATTAGFAVSCRLGRITLAEPDFEIAQGEHIIVYGPPGCGKSTFFRALAGLWPWGTGKVELPSRSEMMFLPHLPYTPLVRCAMS